MTDNFLYCLLICGLVALLGVFMIISAGKAALCGLMGKEEKEED
jgi:hypothetical protein